jgi:uncharacterized membrane protein
MYRMALVTSGALIAAMFGITAWAWTALPGDAAIPVHWGLGGQPDRYGGKGEALLITPIVALALTGMLAIVPRFEPRRQNFAASSGPYTVIWIAVMAFLLVVHVILVLAAMGRPIDMLAAFPVAIGALFVVIGMQMGKTRSNHFMGIRTPWTLSSELSWEETHRVGSWAFMGLGALLALAGLLRNEVLLLGVLILAMPLEMLALIVYSYIVWKRDPNKGKATYS